MRKLERIGFCMECLQSDDNLSQLLSVIVPTRNEAMTIVETIERVSQVLPKAEIIVVDGGCDETEMKVAQRQKDGICIRYHRNRNDRGKGHAIQRGIALSTRPYIAQLDSDLQFWPEDLPVLLRELIQKDADFVCGSRFMRGSSRQPKSVPGLRSLGNRFVSSYASLFMGQWFTDVLAGIKIWRREVTESFRLASNSFCYEVELPLKALRCGYRVIEAPVRTEPRLHGTSSVNTLKTGLELLHKIPRFRLERLQWLP